MTTKKKVKISINPPPQDRCCECCGRHISKLKPFGKAGDPLVGDFDGALLLKNFRAMAPRPKEEPWDTTGMWKKDKPITKAELKEKEQLESELNKRNIAKGRKGYTQTDVFTKKESARYWQLKDKKWKGEQYYLDEDKFLAKHGKKALENYWFHEQLCSTVGASWECRDCMILSCEDYHKKQNEMLKRRRKDG